MSQYAAHSILFQFSKLFILCKFLGIYPYNLQRFQKYKQMKKSTIGTIYTLLAMIVIIALYNLLIFSFSEEDNTLKTSQSTLTFVIGIFLTYIGLVMMVTDQLTAILNQKKVGQLYERIRIVDDRLLGEGCWVDNTILSKHIAIMVILAVMSEIIIMLSSYVVLIQHDKWKSLLWIFSCFPTFYNSLDKIWFAVTIKALQQRFLVLNNALNEMVEEHERYKIFAGTEKEDFLKEENLNFLYAELTGAGANDIVRFKKGKNRIMPVATVAPKFKSFKDLSAKRINQEKIFRESLLNNIFKVEEKLIVYCQIHDELCDIGSTLNELWSYPILVLMAYGFLIFTAQLYFLYCATQKQDIPTLFLSAKNAYITAIFLIYTAGKCIYLIYLSWKTTLESKRTGINLHKCGVVADNNDLYEIISGGITSYLIILIQFNLAAQQAKEAITGTKRTSDMDPGEQINTTTMLKDLILSTISTAFTTEKA